MSQHRLSISQRSSVDISGVTAVVGFDEENVIVDTEDGRLYLSGSGITVEKLDVDRGEVSLKGHVDSLRYTGSDNGGRGILSRIFK